MYIALKAEVDVFIDSYNHCLLESKGETNYTKRLRATRLLSPGVFTDRLCRFSVPDTFYESDRQHVTKISKR